MTPRCLTALPVFNEQLHLAEVLQAVRRFAQDVLVVDDGSTDATPDLLRQESNIHVVTHRPNRGYGAALKSAFDFAVEHNYDVLVTIDCDGQHEPRLIPELAARGISTSRERRWKPFSTSYYSTVTLLARFLG